MVPTHNRRMLLLQTLASVRGQTDVDLEIVVVNDASADDTDSAVRSLGDARIRIAHFDASVGVSAARNRGIQLAAGEWIAFLDDDDLWAPWKLSHQLAAASTSKRGWACSGSVTVDGALEIMTGSAPSSPESIVETLPVRNCVPAGASNVLVQRALLHGAGGFDPQLRHMSDWDLWIRLSARGLPAVVDSPDVAYRLHGANASDNAEVIEHEIVILEARHAEARGGRDIDRAFVLRWAAWNLLRTGNRTAAARLYAKAMAAGDPLSAARAVVAVLDPGVVERTMQRTLDEAWVAPAREWLCTIARDDVA